ncbi:MAG: TonB-dependent receptor [Saprospiraceae bacterium]
MRIFTSFLMTIFCLSNLLYAQPITQTVRGRIIDKHTQFPLIGATVAMKIKDGIVGTVTDLDGSFHLEKVPIGRHDLLVTYVGYEDMVLPQLLVGSGKEVVLNIELQESVKELKTVTVTASGSNKDRPINDMATVSARAFTVEETSRFAASLNDPARMAQSFAGVSSASDNNNEIVIRGNSARGLLWRIEGIEIPNPNHFSSGEGSSGGGISILSNTVMGSSDFLTGAFPAEYGNGLSGVFDIRLRRGNNEQREYALQAGFTGLQAAVEGPFLKKGAAGNRPSYLANYRYSSLALLGKMGFDFNGSDIVPKYQDLTFNLNFPTRRFGRLTIFGIGGISDGGTLADRDSTKWETLSDRFQQRIGRKVGVIGATYTYLLKNNKTYFKLGGAFTIEDDLRQKDSLDNAYSVQQLYRDNFTNSVGHFTFMANHKFSAKHILRLGLNYDRLIFQSELQSFDPQTGLPIQEYDDMRSHLVQTYIQHQWRPVQALEINIGLHHTTFMLNYNHVLEPRLGARWQFAPKMSIGYGLGMHNRLEPISIYSHNLVKPLSDANFVYEGGNSFLFSPRSTLRLTQALHNVLSYDWVILPDLRLRVEAYHQLLFNVPVKNDSTSTLSLLNYNSFDRAFSKEDLVNKGKGYNYGLEFTLEKFFSNNYYFLITSSLFRSQYRALDGVLRNSRFDRNYVFNVVGGKEFVVGKTKEHILGTNAKLVYAGGNRTTPIDLGASQQAGREVLVDGAVFEDRLPAYLRLDLGFSYRWNKPKFALVLSLDVQNVSNRLNVEQRYYDPLSGEIVETKMLGIIPILNGRVEF